METREKNQDLGKISVSISALRTNKIGIRKERKTARASLDLKMWEKDNLEETFFSFWNFKNLKKREEQEKETTISEKLWTFIQKQYWEDVLYNFYYCDKILEV